MKAFLPFYKFDKGLQTRKGENFRDPDEFMVFQNARVRESAYRRPGQDRVAIASGADSAAFNFNGSNQYIEVPFDARVWTLPLRFSLRVVIKQDDNPTGDESIIGWLTGAGPVFLKLDSNRRVVFSITDSASSTTIVTSATALTAGTAYSILITRDKSSLKMWINNTVDATGTMSATLLGAAPTQSLLFATNNSTNWFDGDIDHVLLLGSCLTDNSEGFLRPADPRADDVLAYYPMEDAGNTLVNDFSRFENSGVQGNSPVSAASLCVQDTPVTGMTQFDTGSRKKLLIIAGRLFYAPEIT